jgi:hypothetical protein
MEVSNETTFFSVAESRDGKVFQVSLCHPRPVGRQCDGQVVREATLERRDISAILPLPRSATQDLSRGQRFGDHRNGDSGLETHL